MNRSTDETNTLYESRFYDMRFRGTSNDLSTVKIYTNKNSFQMEKQVSFDSDYEPISSVEYFAGSVLSSILLTLLEQARRTGLAIEEIEGVLNLSLENPLSLVGVRGYDEEPSIQTIAVTVFLYVELEGREFEDFCFGALKKSPIYNTLRRSMELEVVFKKLV